MRNSTADPARVIKLPTDDRKAGFDAEGYLIHAWIRQITLMIWRRLLARATLADLRWALRIAFAWTDY